MNYWSGDWGAGDINRWGPSAWGTVTIWHDLSLIGEGHSMVLGGNRGASNYKYFAGGGGLIYTSDYFGRFQPFFKGEAGMASLTHPSKFNRPFPPNEQHLDRGRRRGIPHLGKVLDPSSNIRMISSPIFIAVSATRTIL